MRNNSASHEPTYIHKFQISLKTKILIQSHRKFKKDNKEYNKQIDEH